MTTRILATEVEDSHTLVDVRSPAEFAAERIPGARNIPLAELEARCSTLTGSSNLVLVCASGMRAEKARAILAGHGLEACVLEGGLKEWNRHSLPIEKAGGHISIERQVRIVAGAMAALGGALAILLHPWFAGLSVFVGCGLMFAGLTDTCGMALLLARLPYNTRGARTCCAAPSGRLSGNDTV